MKDIIKKTKDNRVVLSVSNIVYEERAITQTVYKFTDICFMHIDKSENDKTDIFFKLKENVSEQVESIVERFCNELIDQQVRVQTEREYKTIREEIVKKAFKSIS